MTAARSGACLQEPRSGALSGNIAATCYYPTMFEIRNSADYYAMLVEDFDEFMRQPQSSRCAIHCAITAYHMHEWVWHDWLKDRDDIKAKLGLTDIASFRRYLRGGVWLEILREIANGSKHFKKQAFDTQLVRGYGQGPFGVGPYGHGYLLIDLGGDEPGSEPPLDEFGEPNDGVPDGGDQRFLPAANLLEVCVRFWRDFFKQHRPDLTVPASTHHTL